MADAERGFQSDGAFGKESECAAHLAGRNQRGQDLPQDNAAQVGPIHGDRQVIGMEKEKAAPVVTHGKRQAKVPNLILSFSDVVCKYIASGMLGVAIAFPLGLMGRVLFAALAVWLGVITEC